MGNDCKIDIITISKCHKQKQIILLEFFHFGSLSNQTIEVITSDNHHVSSVDVRIYWPKEIENHNYT